MDKNLNGQAHKSEEETPERRRFLGRMLGAINLFVFGSVLVPVVGFICSPLNIRRKSEWVEIADENEVPMNSTKEVRFNTKVRDGYRIADRTYAVYLRRTQDGVLVINPSCTHLGCKVNYQEPKDRFVCPCHGGVFDAVGNNVSGPPPKPLERYASKIDGGKVFIRLEV